jgi:hypothetical protein
MIEDRTRSFIEVNAWSSGGAILASSAVGFHMNRWDNQGCRVFCIVEKEALVGVLQGVCRQWDVPLLAARGYPSATVIREFGKDVVMEAGQNDERVIILHLGDHDPSGIDMSRDLEKRISLYSRDTPFEFRRLALNYEQIEELKPPPNPAKTTDSRYADYKARFGKESWELDALSPSYLSDLVTSEVEKIIDFELWEKKDQEIADVKSRLRAIAEQFDNGA